MLADRGNRREWLLFALLAAGCVVIGAVARFWALGRWPLAIDEYYFAQSVQNVLHTGLPRYACGGLYTRGLLLQYAAALLQQLGLSAELAPRLIAALCSLMTLPAVYQLGRRIGSQRVGLLAVALLAISVWEVEMARFGRMYAPFQAVFAWYVVFFLSYTLDRSRRALLPMLALSAIGVLVWEGGVLLLVINLLAPFVNNPTGRLSRSDCGYLAFASLLLLPGYWLVTTDLRTSDSDLPADYQPGPDVDLSRLEGARMPWRTLPAHPLWALVGLIPVALTLFAIFRTARARPGWLPTLGIAAALLAGLAQQFEAALAVLVILLLLSVVGWRQLLTREAWPLQAALLSSLAFWLAYGVSTSDWHPAGLTPPRTALLLMYEFVRFPDVVREVAVPWARTAPMLAGGLLLATVVSCVRVCRQPDQRNAAERILLALAVILVLAASASGPPRHETRYVFFLYPLAILFGVQTIALVVQDAVSERASAGIAVALVSCVAFALSEDFRPLHLRDIGTESVNFRLRMSQSQVQHYHPRSDIRGAAVWLDRHVDPRRDRVVNSYPGVDFYYPAANFYFMEDSDPRFEGWACRSGTLERWSNKPLLRSVSALQSQVAAGHRVWLVIEANRLRDIVGRLPADESHREWTSVGRDIVIVSLQAPASRLSER